MNLHLNLLQNETQPALLKLPFALTQALQANWTEGACVGVLITQDDTSTIHLSHSTTQHKNLPKLCRASALPQERPLHLFLELRPPLNAPNAFLHTSPPPVITFNWLPKDLKKLVLPTSPQCKSISNLPSKSTAATLPTLKLLGEAQTTRPSPGKVPGTNQLFKYYSDGDLDDSYGRPHSGGAMNRGPVTEAAVSAIQNRLFQTLEKNGPTGLTLRGAIQATGAPARVVKTILDNIAQSTMTKGQNVWILRQMFQ